jgi:hypothetical protein
VPKALAVAALVAVPTACTAGSALDHSSGFADGQLAVAGKPSGGTPQPPPAPARARVEAITSVVGNRFAALARGDRTGWLAALASDAAPAERDEQGRIFDRMRAMGVADLRIVSVALLGGPTACQVPSCRARLTATYRLAPFDRSPRTFVVDLSVETLTEATSHTPSGTADQSPLDSARAGGSNAAQGGSVARLRTWAPAVRPQPWDLEGLRVRRTPDALLLVVGSDATLKELTRRTRAAARQVAAVWGQAQPSVWVAPATDDDAARLLGRTGEAMTSVAAVTDGPLEAGSRAGADRIVIAPSAWAGLTGAGRDVVLTHELTHATVRAATTRTVPDWLAEGFAELVAYRTVPLPERDAVAPALALVRSQGLPAALPTDADFNPAAGRLQAAYGLSLLAVRELADRQGTAAVVRLYREAAGGLAVPAASLGDAEAVTNLALERAGTDRTTLVAQWRERIASLLRR